MTAHGDGGGRGGGGRDLEGVLTSVSALLGTTGQVSLCLFPIWIASEVQ